MMKSSQFSGERDEVKWLCKDILQHCVKGDKDSSGRMLDGNILTIDVESIHRTDSKVKVLLKGNTDALIRVPVFFP
jgi:hypothetical protein